MATLKLPAAVAGPGTKMTLVLLDRVLQCELTEAHVNAILKSVGGDMAFVDDELLCKFKILAQETLKPEQRGAVQAAIQKVLHDRDERQITLEG